jgi:hypothetical protein
MHSRDHDEDPAMATTRDTRSDLSPHKVAERLKEEGKQRLERGKSTAADQVDQVASALRSAGDELGGQSSLGTYANQLAESISRFGTRLRDGSIEDLMQDMQTAARRNPALFIAGGFAAGMVLARLIKASAPEEPYLYEGEYDDLTAGSYRPGDGRGVDAPTIDVSGEGAGTRPGTFGG